MTNTQCRVEAKAETRRALISAAAHVFAARGYEAASVDELAGAAGFTIGALYRHFTNKEGLFLAVIEEEVLAQNRRLRAVIARGDNFDDQMEALASQIVAETAEARRTTLLFMEFWLYAARHAESRPELAEGYRVWQRAFLKTITQKWKAQGAARAVAPPVLAAMLAALSDGLTRLHLLMPERVGKQAMTQGVRLLLGRPPRTK